VAEKEKILALCGSAVSFGNVAGNRNERAPEWFVSPNRSESGKAAVSLYIAKLS
jgi:hypothetical protein